MEHFVSAFVFVTYVMNYAISKCTDRGRKEKSIIIQLLLFLNKYIYKQWNENFSVFPSREREILFSFSFNEIQSIRVFEKDLMPLKEASTSPT